MSIVADRAPDFWTIEPALLLDSVGEMADQLLPPAPQLTHHEIQAAEQATTLLLASPRWMLREPNVNN